MTISLELRVVELLAARLCHDLIGPVAAIGNGAELLGDDDPGFFRDAVALIGGSARKASRRLQFYRFAYGYGGGALAGPQPHQLAAEFLAETAIECDYTSAARELGLKRQQLACAMLAVAGEGMPHGGLLAVKAGEAGPEIEATGARAGLPPGSLPALTLAVPVGELTARTVAAYFAGSLAAAQDLRITGADRPGGFRLSVGRG